MLFSHHEDISPGLQSILRDFDEDLTLGLYETERVLQQDFERQRHGCFRYQSDED
jgi:hypothetical protein